MPSTSLTLRPLGLALVVALMAGCAPRFAQPFAIEAPRPGGLAGAATLADVPAPADPVVVAVYRFRDQTGQYRALENLSTFSTSVTQGATSILIGALEASGFFVPIEREGLSNLLNERQIISSTRQQYSGPEGEGLGPLPPLLYAGVLLEGGVVGYDSNVLTGGAGARILGVGAAGQFRQDQVTVYLRAVSVQTGRVLQSVHVTKTILSQKLDGGAFLYVDADVLLEAEAGYSTNEPPVLAVTAAVEEAIVALVAEGARDGLWAFAAPDGPDAQAFLAAYDARVAAARQRDVFDRLPLDRDRGRTGPLPAGVLSASVGLGDLQSDYAGPDARPVGTVELGARVRGGVFAGLRAGGGFIDVNGRGETFASLAGVVRARAFPSFRTSPTVSVGVGALSVPKTVGTVAYGTASLGLETRLGGRLGFLVEAGVDYPFVEGIDGLRGVGGVHDNLWVGRAGLTVRLP